ncbi:uncharacterized protein LOC129000683 [Macrosteles quadrilineatus]|uniref:uncharacterized protein LOC129000683 n=1 Tax=Macrosteles quadrilineatus TaxID=74068 RepID=UPI0023E21490|nr:uncharacterized protein LOC129000683 [Macrosteles quadrilineatus]
MFKKCCFCVSLKKGSYLIGVYAVLASLATMQYLIYEAENLRKEENEPEENLHQKLQRKQFFVILMACQVFKICAGITIVLAVCKEKPKVLIVAAVSFFSVFVHALIVEFIKLAATGNGTKGLISAALTIFLILYFTLILWSHAQELIKEEEWEYYDDESVDQDP